MVQYILTLVTSTHDEVTSEEPLLYNHVCTSLSALDQEMIRSVPPGGNWKDIPLHIAKKSARVMQIRKSGGRTTYYGRLRNDMPSYTISTYFNRPGNGTFIHPEQDRLISIREAARLQSFPDSFRFLGSTSSMYKQIGNAVPPLLALALGATIPQGLAIDLFAGAGGLSQGLSLGGHRVIAGADLNDNMLQTYGRNHPETPVVKCDLSKRGDLSALIEEVENELHGRTLNLIAGGPPCQGFSTAGKGNLSDIRNILYIPFLEIVESLSPEYLLIENVPGLLFHNKGKTLNDILARLESLEFRCSVFKLRAEQFGVPQRRRRVFITGSRTSDLPPLPPPIFPAVVRGVVIRTDDQKSFLPAFPVAVDEAISDLPEIEAGGGGKAQEYAKVHLNSDYQRLMRGTLSWSEFISSRAEQD
ncbi:MAG: DNA (cytosine-5-)-methyltransferase [Candidatus Thorarchaeota archaeon]|nr:DNA (cytosine-5-)-methyltransferase [Candidatus Thorarchaeota archaeon]